MGGYRSWMLSALSDRIKAGASVCWMVTTDVQMSVKDRKREYGGFANCIPGLRQYLDYPHIASIACPRAMLLSMDVRTIYSRLTVSRMLIPRCTKCGTARMQDTALPLNYGISLIRAVRRCRVVCWSSLTLICKGDNLLETV